MEDIDKQGRGSDESDSEEYRAGSSPSRRSRREIHRQDRSNSRVRSTGSALRELALIFIAALIISALIRAFIVQVFEIPSGSMEDTLQTGDRVMVSKMVPRFREVHRGDVVVFSDTQGWLPQSGDAAETDFFIKTLVFLGLRPETSEQHVIKRIIGLPGDRVQCCDRTGHLQVNGFSIEESGYLKPGAAPSEEEFDVTVPENSLWVMGDNRAHSADSRAHTNGPGAGFVSIDDVTGRAFLIMYPFDRFGRVTTTRAFVGVPDPGPPEDTGGADQE